MESQVCTVIHAQHPLISLIGHRYPYCHECKDGLGVRSSNSWYFSVYFDFYVRFSSPLNGCWIPHFVSISDKAGRSIPAPGRGALTVAREVPSKHPLPILDVSYRSRQLTFRRSQISQWLLHEETQLQEEIQYRKQQNETIEEEYIASRIADLEVEAKRQEKEALAVYGMLESFDPRVAPLRRALAVWGLTADDIGVLSIHGTSTVANVRNYFPW
jgi:fatty acid synthase subunit alpha